jgi:hypothetical protein
LKTQHDGKGLADTVMVCEVWMLEVVPSGVCKRANKSIITPLNCDNIFNRTPVFFKITNTTKRRFTTDYMCVLLVGDGVRLRPPAVVL